MTFCFLDPIHLQSHLTVEGTNRVNTDDVPTLVDGMAFTEVFTYSSCCRL